MFYEPQGEDLEALQPMFSVCWLPSLATFSVLLEDPQSDTLNEYHNMRDFGTISFDGNHPHVGGAHQYFKPNNTEYAVCMRCMVRINPQ